MSSYKGSSGISSARRVLRESRTGRESFDGTLSLPLSPRSTQGRSSGFSRGPTTDLEAPLLEQRTAEAAEAAELAAAARAAEAREAAAAAAVRATSGDEGGGAADEAGDDVPQPRSSRPSLTGPGYQNHRDSRQLWRAVRSNLGERWKGSRLSAVRCRLEQGRKGGRRTTACSTGAACRRTGACQQACSPPLPPAACPAVDPSLAAALLLLLLRTKPSRHALLVQACRTARTARALPMWSAQGRAPCRALPPRSAWPAASPTRRRSPTRSSRWAGACGPRPAAAGRATRALPSAPPAAAARRSRVLQLRAHSLLLLMLLCCCLASHPPRCLLAL